MTTMQKQQTASSFNTNCQAWLRKTIRTAITIIAGFASAAVLAAPTIELTSPGAEQTYVATATVDLSVNVTPSTGTTIKSVAYYRGTTLIATVTAAPYAYTWTKVAAGTYSITAKATDNLNAATTSAARTITVNANKAPTVSLASPEAASTTIYPNNIILTADTADSDGTITKVDYYRSSTLIGSSTTPPFSYTWATPAIGTYSLTAKATDDKGAVTTSTARSIYVKAAPPTLTLTGPGNGQTYVAPASVTLTAEATPAAGATISSVEFYRGTTRIASDTSAPYAYAWNNVAAGTYEITAKVTDNRGNVVISPIHTITVNANQAPNVTLTSPQADDVAIYPNDVTLSADASDTDGSIKSVSFYRSTTLIGTVTTPPFTYTWASPAIGTYSITAKATDDKGTVTATAVSTLKVTAAPPTVNLTAPQVGETFIVPGTITLSATATPAAGAAISSIEFYRDGTLLYKDTSSPYTYNWTNATAGTYQITARVTDNRGNIVTSLASTITVNANQAPSVMVSAPDNGQTYVAPASVIISANASDADGTITKVELYRGTTRLATLSAPPYTYTWANAAAGTYPITAKATDDKGAITTSEAKNIVISTNKAPTVDLIVPNNNETFTAPATITILANTADSDGTIAKVEFYQGTTLLGTKTAAPYSFIWNDVQVGTYTITAKATDDKGTTTTSTIRTVKVENSSPVISSGIYYIHTDHLNTPRLVTNEQNQAVWENSPVTEPFGTSIPNEDPMNTGKSFVMKLRFPGQYYDKETNTHYNYFRDYDPLKGRYWQSDPIGLADGINTYLYVNGNPMSFVDPRGLAIGDFPPPPPGYDPKTWPTGQWPNNGKLYLVDPKTGKIYTAHPEDSGHWRHWDKQDSDGDDDGTWPPNNRKPWPGQKKLKKSQCETDPNGSEEPLDLQNHDRVIGDPINLFRDPSGTPGFDGKTPFIPGLINPPIFMSPQPILVPI